MKLFKTTEVTRILGAGPWEVVGLLRYDRLLPKPEKDSSGDYLWTEADVERARQALRAHRARKVRRGPAPLPAAAAGAGRAV
jgi:hypothetical protein